MTGTERPPAGGENDLRELLAGMSAYRRPGEYVFVTLPGRQPRDWPAVDVLATVDEPEGMSAVITRAHADLAGLGYDFIAAWLSLTVHSALDAVGLTAALATALGAGGISANVIAGRFHDHVLVPVASADAALGVLATLSAGARDALGRTEIGRPQAPGTRVIRHAGSRTDPEMS